MHVGARGGGGDRLPVGPDARAPGRGRAGSTRRRWRPASRTYDGGVPLDVAVQVVNYRTRRQLEPCLESVLARPRGAARRPRARARQRVGRRPVELRGAPSGGRVRDGRAQPRLRRRPQPARRAARRAGAAVAEPRRAVRRAAHGRAAARGAAAADVGGRRAAARVGGGRGRPARPRRAARLPRPRRAGGRAQPLPPPRRARPTSRGCRAPRASSHASGSTRVGGFDPGFFLLQGGGGPVPADPARRAAACATCRPSACATTGGVVASRDEHLAASVDALRATSTCARRG